MAVKSFSEFYKDKSTKSGFTCYCKECQKNYHHAHKTKANRNGKNYRKTIIGCLHNRFGAMKRRCNNSKHPQYKNYGGRGIKCLFKNVDEFINYVIDELRVDPHGLDIDRIDNDGHYEPGNIRLVSHAENLKNTRKK